MEIKFRRSTQSPKTKVVLKTFLAVVVFGIIFIYGLLQLSKPNPIVQTVYLDITCLENNTFFLEGDTVSYDNFATSFMKSVRIKKIEYDSTKLKIRCYIPKAFTTGQIQDILQVIQATHPAYELHIAP